MAKFEEVEDALVLWFKAIRDKNVPVIYFSLSIILLQRNTINTKFVSSPMDFMLTRFYCMYLLTMSVYLGQWFRNL